jgi:predicted S18 family serine protease
MKSVGFKSKANKHLQNPVILYTARPKAYAVTRVWVAVTLIALLLAIPYEAESFQELGAPIRQKEQQIAILGVTTESGQEVGALAHLAVVFVERADTSGLAVVFPRASGRLSPMAETSVQQAIYRAARVAGLSPDSWSVRISVLQSGLTIHGSSLSAMVGVTVIALAKGHSILPDRVITGTIAPDGCIAMVSGIPLKLDAAHHAHYRQVLVPEEISISDGDWRTPFLMQVSPVGSVVQAYLSLTGFPLLSP